MNMLNEVYLYELDTDNNELVGVSPTRNEELNGRRMAATINLLAKEWLASGKESRRDTTIGEMRYSENLRRKTREAKIVMAVGDFGYHELRRWICLACQYLMGEYPIVIYDMDRAVCRIRFDSNKSIALDGVA